MVCLFSRLAFKMGCLQNKKVNKDDYEYLFIFSVNAFSVPWELHCPEVSTSRESKASTRVCLHSNNDYMVFDNGLLCTGVDTQLAVVTNTRLVVTEAVRVGSFLLHLSSSSEDDGKALNPHRQRLTRQDLQQTRTPRFLDFTQTPITGQCTIETSIKV